jgi:hypothetical protein
MTAIGYDNNETGLGSGVQPMQTSTHEYFVDDKAPEELYSYEWKLFQNDGVTEVNSALSTVNNNPTHIKISFTGIQTGNYILSVIKTKNGTSCKKTETIYVAVVENTFDTELNLAGNQCQAGETGTPSTIIWEVTFSDGGVAPYSLNYTVNLKEENDTPIAVCSGTVKNITKTGFDHSSGCMQVEKMATDSYTVRLEYTMNSVTAKNFKVSIQIDATDKFSVSEIIPGNNSETLIEHGVPDTSAITTD